ncbi:hypothetical protein ACFQDN_20340 [Pseudomonas asuensis]|uniref:Methyl-accepting chemotaxis protein n=1 Tax=Pseudomonas asuensis TaxID=1825787 RepID=A0ABQ2H3Q3_9PSED|nr:hypothetical protein GCM10009425_44890 [Pseudomonas asuensis]
MKFKSIQFSIMLYAGACILAVVLALVGYALVSCARSQATTADGTHRLVEQLIKARVTTLAQASVDRLQHELEAPLGIAKHLASLSA